MTALIVDLNRYRSEGSRVLSGRSRGQVVRYDADLPQADLSDRTVTIVVPEDLYAVTSSFFLGMFGDSIRQLGAAEFRRKYEFEGLDISSLVEDSIREALRYRSPL